MNTETEGPRKIYGNWAGNPRGTPYNPARCAANVYGSERGAIAHQCHKPRGFGQGELWCKTHDPERVKAKQDASYAKYRAKIDQEQRRIDLREKRKEVADLAIELVKVRSFGAAFDALAKAVEELNAMEKES